MAASRPTLAIAPEQPEIPAGLLRVCFALCVVNLTLGVVAYSSHWWIYDSNGLGIPTDFINVWAAGRLVLDGLPAQAYDWDIQKQIEVAKLGQDFVGYFAWHYPPPFLFVASVLAQLPYSVGYLGWVLVSIVPYLVVMRAIVGHNFGLLLALAAPMAFLNALVGQNGFLTAALIGGALFLIPMRPVLAGICLGLLTYKPQYGLLFPIALIAAGHWRVFISASVTAIAMFFVSWLAFGTESWLAFFHWMPRFSQAFLTEGKATWWKLQSIFSVVGYFGGTGGGRDAESERLQIASLERWKGIAARAGVDVNITNHPLHSESIEKEYLLHYRTPDQPNPFVLGKERYQRYVAIQQECARIELARLGFAQ